MLSRIEGLSLEQRPPGQPLPQWNGGRVRRSGVRRPGRGLAFPLLRAVPFCFVITGRRKPSYRNLEALVRAKTWRR